MTQNAPTTSTPSSPACPGAEFLTPAEIEAYRMAKAQFANATAALELARLQQVAARLALENASLRLFVVYGLGPEDQIDEATGAVRRAPKPQPPAATAPATPAEAFPAPQPSARRCEECGALEGDGTEGCLETDPPVHRFQSAASGQGVA